VEQENMQMAPATSEAPLHAAPARREPVVTPPIALALIACGVSFLACAVLVLLSLLSEKLPIEAVAPAAVIIGLTSLLAPATYALIGPRPVSVYGTMVLGVAGARLLLSVAIGFATQKLLTPDANAFWTSFAILAAIALIAEKLAALKPILDSTRAGDDHHPRRGAEVTG